MTETGTAASPQLEKRWFRIAHYVDARSDEHDNHDVLPGAVSRFPALAPTQHRFVPYRLSRAVGSKARSTYNFADRRGQRRSRSDLIRIGRSADNPHRQAAPH
jgi:hypothetical protein